MIIAQLEAREELDLGDEGRGHSGHGSGHDSNLKSRNTKLPMHVAVLHSCFHCASAVSEGTCALDDLFKHDVCCQCGRHVVRMLSVRIVFIHEHAYGVSVAYSTKCDIQLPVCERSVRLVFRMRPGGRVV